MPRFLPGLPEGADLLRLLDMERLARFIRLQGGALQIHAKLRRPNRRGVGAGTPPDALAQPFGMWLQPQKAGRVGEHRSRVRFGKAFALQQFEEDLGMLPRHILFALAFSGAVTEVTPAVDHLFRRAAADAELQAAAGDEIGRTCVFSHVERVFIAHVDDAGTDLDALRSGADGREQREGEASWRAKWCTRK